MTEIPFKFNYLPGPVSSTTNNYNSVFVMFWNVVLILLQ